MFLLQAFHKALEQRCCLTSETDFCVCVMLLSLPVNHKHLRVYSNISHQSSLALEIQQFFCVFVFYVNFFL